MELAFHDKTLRLPLAIARTMLRNPPLLVHAGPRAPGRRPGAQFREAGGSGE
ncbi:hypothetical protein AB4039_16325 [Streptomyces sp. M-16]|uniref:hypothetical protein n=1 Tax=Streptomyces sp. M-16 TaxID=3233040 RepID=UPI003F984025